MIGKLFIVSAPSGAGKTTLVNEVVKKFKNQFNLKRVITYTTRHKRPNDIHGKDYYFISKHEFEKKIRENFFMEYSCEYDNYYGSPHHIIGELMTGISYCMIVDIVGAMTLYQKLDEAVFIWIYPKSIQVLKQRLLNRAADTYEEIERRLQLAAKEISCERKNSIFMYKVLNDDFQSARDDLMGIVQKELLK